MNTLLSGLCMKFYPSAVRGAPILDGINPDLPRIALLYSPYRFLQQSGLRASFRHFHSRRQCRFPSCSEWWSTFVSGYFLLSSTIITHMADMDIRVTSSLKAHQRRLNSKPYVPSATFGASMLDAKAPLPRTALLSPLPFPIPAPTISRKMKGLGGEISYASFLHKRTYKKKMLPVLGSSSALQQTSYESFMRYCPN